MNQQCLELTSGLRLVRLGSRNSNETVNDFLDFVVGTDRHYSEIENWVRARVFPSLANSSRIGYLAYSGSRPVASLIARRGEAAKLCNLRISPDWQDKRLGTLLIGLAAISIWQRSSEMYFTIPASVWIEHAQFFQGLGFRNKGMADKQYRLWEEEYACSASMTDVLMNIRERLPGVLCGFTVNGHTSADSLVMSINPKHVRSILSGRKDVEIRRQFSHRWAGARTLIYSTAPESRIVGDMRLLEVETGCPTTIWERYGDRLGCTKAEFTEYCSNADVIHAIRIGEVRAYSYPIPRREIEDLLGIALRPPQSYSTVTPSSSWASAASIGSLLQLQNSI